MVWIGRGDPLRAGAAPRGGPARPAPRLTCFIGSPSAPRSLAAAADALLHAGAGMPAGVATVQGHPMGLPCRRGRAPEDALRQAGASRSRPIASCAIRATARSPASEACVMCSASAAMSAARGERFPGAADAAADPGSAVGPGLGRTPSTGSEPSPCPSKTLGKATGRDGSGSPVRTTHRTTPARRSSDPYLSIARPPGAGRRTPRSRSPDPQEPVVDPEEPVVGPRGAGRATPIYRSRDPLLAIVQPPRGDRPIPICSSPDR
jgi:hypothetical protein